jgi:uncharacterized protein (TIGR00725 family)
MSETDPPLRVSIVGGGQASDEELQMAESLGEAIGRAGGVVVTGGLGGVMEAASRGCYRSGGTVIGILPGRDPSDANRWVALPLATGMGEARNALVVRAGEAVVSVGGGWGTLSEIALARKMGIPVAVLGDPPSDLELPRPGSPELAAEWALRKARESRGP